MLLSVLKNVDRTSRRTAVIFGANVRIVSKGFTEFCGNLECDTKADHACLDDFYCRGYQDISPSVRYPDIPRPFSETVQLSLADPF